MSKYTSVKDELPGVIIKLYIYIYKTCIYMYIHIYTHVSFVLAIFESFLIIHA